MDIIKITVLVALVIISVIYYIIAYKSMPKIEKLSDFFLSDKALNNRSIFHSTFAQGMSLATVFIAFLQLAGVLKGVLIWATLTYAAGWFAFAFLSKKIANNKDIGTLHDFLGKKFNSRTIVVITSIATSIGFIGILSTELIVGSNIFSNLNINNVNFFYYGLFFITLCLLIYTTLGGFRAVIKTDIYQSFLIFGATIALLVISLIVLYKEPTITLTKTFSDFFNFNASSGILLLNLFLINTLFPFVDMSAWQRLIASKNEKESKKGTINSSIAFFTTWLILIFVSILLTYKVNSSTSDGGLFEIFNLLVMYGINDIFIFLLGIIAFGGFISAMLSTSDSFLISTSQTISMDIVYHKTNKTDKQIISNARIQLFFILVVGVSLSLLLYKSGFKIVDLIFSIYGATLSLFPLVIIAFFVKSAENLRNWGVISVISGILLAWLNGFYSVFLPQNIDFVNQLQNSLLFWYKNPSTYNSPTIAIVVSSIVMFIGFIISKIKK